MLYSIFYHTVGEECVVAFLRHFVYSRDVYAKVVILEEYNVKVCTVCNGICKYDIAPTFVVARIIVHVYCEIFIICPVLTISLNPGICRIIMRFADECINNDIIACRVTACINHHFIALTRTIRTFIFHYSFIIFRTCSKRTCAFYGKHAFRRCCIILNAYKVIIYVNNRAVYHLTAICITSIGVCSYFGNHFGINRRRFLYGFRLCTGNVVYGVRFHRILFIVYVDYVAIFHRFKIYVAIIRVGFYRRCINTLHRGGVYRFHCIAVFQNVINRIFRSEI